MKRIVTTLNFNEALIMNVQELNDLICLLVKIRLDPFNISAETLVQVKQMIIDLRGKE